MEIISKVGQYFKVDHFQYIHTAVIGTCKTGSENKYDPIVLWKRLYELYSQNTFTVIQYQMYNLASDFFEKRR